MKSNILTPEMSFRDIFIAYLEAAETGLFESGNFFITDHDFQILFKTVLSNLRSSAAAYSKEQKRLWALCIRELVFRYATKYNELWISLQKGFGIEVRKAFQGDNPARVNPSLLSKLYSDDAEIEQLHFENIPQKIQNFCYDNNGDALNYFFNKSVFDNAEYSFPDFQHSDFRYIRFLLKISVLPANYFPDSKIYSSLRNAYQESLRPYWSDEKTEDLFQKKMKAILGDEPGWNLHENTLVAFSERMLEYFTLVLSWRRCDYSEEEAVQELKNSFDFVSLNSTKTHYLLQFLNKEYMHYSKDSLPSDENSKDSRLECLKKMLQIDCRLSRETRQFGFRLSRDMGIYAFVIEYVASVSGQNQLVQKTKLRRFLIEISSVAGEKLAIVSINGKLSAEGETLAQKNENFLKLIRQKVLNFKIGTEMVRDVDNPWYRANLWFLQNAYGEPASTWNVFKKAYIVYPREYGEVNYGKSGLSSASLPYCEVESHNSGVNIYCLEPNEELSQEMVTVYAGDNERCQIELRDAAYIRCVSKFEGTPYFVQQNLRSKIAFGRIEFHCPDAQNYHTQNSDVSVSIQNGLLVIENRSGKTVALEDNSQIIGTVKPHLPMECRFPKIILYPSNAYIWVTSDRHSTMGHYELNGNCHDNFAIFGGYDCIAVSDDGSISPCRWNESNEKLIFKLIMPEWNGVLSDANCSSDVLSLTSSWFTPDPCYVDLFFRWNEDDLEFEVTLSPEERVKMEELGSSKGLAGIYRTLEINGAKLTCGWRFKGKTFYKTFAQTPSYTCPKRNPRLCEIAKNASDAGNVLKNSILNRKEIEEACEEACRCIRRYDPSFKIYPDWFVSVEEVKNFLKGYDVKKACFDCTSPSAKFFDKNGSEITQWDGVATAYLTYPSEWGGITEITEGVTKKCLSINGLHSRMVYVLTPQREYACTKIKIKTVWGEIIKLEMPVMNVLKAGAQFGDTIVGFGSVALHNAVDIRVFSDIPGVEAEFVGAEVSLKNSTRNIIAFPRKLLISNAGTFVRPSFVLLPEGVKLYSVKQKQKAFAVLEGDIEGLDESWEKDETIGGFVKELSYGLLKLQLAENLEIRFSSFDINSVDVFFANQLGKTQFDGISFSAGECRYESMLPGVIEKGVCAVLNTLPMNSTDFDFVGKMGHDYLHAQFCDFKKIASAPNCEGKDVTTFLYDSRTIPSRGIQEKVLKIGKQIGIRSISLLQEMVVSNIRVENESSYISKFLTDVYLNRLRPSEKNVIAKLGGTKVFFSPVDSKYAAEVGFRNACANAGAFRSVVDHLKMDCGSKASIYSYYEGFTRGKRIRDKARMVPADSFAESLKWDEENTLLHAMENSREPKIKGDWTLVSFPFDEDVSFEKIERISKHFATLEDERSQRKAEPVNVQISVPICSRPEPKLVSKTSQNSTLKQTVTKKTVGTTFETGWRPTAKISRPPKN